ncbi:MAG: ribbon-helix-helix domain-containing protein [Tepidisphaeraceae bacterium]
MKTKKPLTAERFLALSDAEKEAIYQECEKIGPGDGVPLSRAQKAQHARWMRKYGRTPPPKPVKRVQISMEQALLKAADRFAAEHGLSRSQVTAQGVRKLLAG